MTPTNKCKTCLGAGYADNSYLGHMKCPRCNGTGTEPIAPALVKVINSVDGPRVVPTNPPKSLSQPTTPADKLYIDEAQHLTPEMLAELDKIELPPEVAGKLEYRHTPADEPEYDKTLKFMYDQGYFDAQMDAIYKDAAPTEPEHQQYTDLNGVSETANSVISERQEGLREILENLFEVEGLTGHSLGCQYLDETIGCTCGYEIEQLTLSEIDEALAAINAHEQKAIEAFAEAVKEELGSGLDDRNKIDQALATYKGELK